MPKLEGGDMTTGWIIRGHALRTRSRQAGGWALKGFELQQQYAALKVIELLGCVGGLIAVRYEGAQDVDLMYASGQVVHVQIKNRPSEVLNWANLEPALLGFVDDWIDADAVDRGRLAFRLITVSMPDGEDAARVARKIYLKTIASKLAKAADGALRRKFGAVLKEHAHAVLQSTTIEVATESFADYVRLSIRGRLAPFVQDSGDASNVIAAILSALKAGTVVTARDALDLIRQQSLSERHPFRTDSPFKAVGVGLKTLSDCAVESFRKGALVPWEGLDDSIDVQREVAHDLTTRLSSASQVEFHVLVGPGGAGKTTVARRVVYDLSKTGSVLAFDLVDQDPTPKDWRALFSFGRAMERRILLLVDDPKERTAAIEYLLSIDTDLQITVLMTRRPSAETEAMLREAKVPVCDTPIGPITDVEVQRLSLILGKDPPSKIELAELKISGQFFLLAMIMAAGSVEQFASKLLKPLRATGADVFEAYVDLCLSARQDQRIPESILLKRYPNAVGLDQNVRFTGLVRRLGARMDALRAGHALLSAAVVKVEGVNPAIRALALLECVDGASDVERRFGVRLVQSVVSIDPGPSSAVAQQLTDHLLRFTEHGHYSDLHRIIIALRDLGSTTAETLVRRTAAAAPIRTGVDASIKMAQALSPKAFEALFDELLEFYGKNFTDFGRRNFIARCSSEVTAVQATAMLKAMFPWILTHGCPAPESKSLLDVLSTRTDVETILFKDQIAALLEAMPSDVRLLYPATAILESRLPDRVLNAELAAYAARTLTIESAIAFPPACTIYARLVRRQGEKKVQASLAKLLLQAAEDSRLDGDGQKRKTLLAAALTCETDEGLEYLRRAALKISFPSWMADEARNMLTFIRTQSELG